jgi:uncharacterized membrane protein YkoI
MLKSTKLVLVAAALTTIGAVSYAANSKDNDAMAIEQAKVSLSQAIATAEQHAGGKAARAEFEKGKAGKSVFEVEVVNGANTFDVNVDANTGTVISSAQDKMDGDRDGDGDQEKDD